MDLCMDILHCLDHDTCLKILTCLEDPGDVVRASVVSRAWHQFVVQNGLCRHLCLRLFTPLSRLDRVIQVDHDIGSQGVGPSRYMELALDRDHRAFAYLAHACESARITHCISEAVSASSTDNYPEESVHNTLDSRVRIGRRASYWSSKGQSNSAVPETLIYKLCSKICLLTQINIRPFEAYFQIGNPIYSAQSVRFRIGHPKNPKDDIASFFRNEQCPEPADDKFIWTYTSESFPMVQDSQLQKFKLPEPVLCIGGFLQIELMGRVQRQQMDGLFYICVGNVQALGRSLSPAFDAEILEPSGKFQLKYFPNMQLAVNQSDIPEEPSEDSDQYWPPLGVDGLPDMPFLMNMLRNRGWNVINELDEDIEEAEDSDEEMVA